MAAFQKETGMCTGRGFAAVDANGFMAKFYTWVTKAYAAGGPRWYIIADKSAPAAQTFVADHTTEEFTAASHGYSTGDEVQVSTTGALPTGLVAGTTYYVIRLSANVFKLATTYENAMHSVVKTISDNGSGTNSVTLVSPYIVISDVSSPTVNDLSGGAGGNAPKFLKIGYRVGEAGYVRFEAFFYWEGSGAFSGRMSTYCIPSVDAGDFVYHFSGGAECMCIRSRIGSSWKAAVIDDADGDTNFLEPTSKVGTFASGVTAGSSVVCSLGAGEAAHFTVNGWYYLTNFAPAVNWWGLSDYVKVTARNLVADTVTIDHCTVNFPAGTRISAYGHRWITWSDGSSATDTNYYVGGLTVGIPYVSRYTYERSGSPSGYVYQRGWIVVVDDLVALYNPGDDGLYAAQRPLVREYSDGNNESTYMNRAYFKPRNLYYSLNRSLLLGSDGITISGIDYVYISIPITYRGYFWRDTASTS